MQCCINVVQRCFDVVLTSGSDIVSTLWNVENLTSNFISISTSDQRYFNANLHVETTLILNVETTLIQRWNVGWVPKYPKPVKLPRLNLHSNNNENHSFPSFEGSVAIHFTITMWGRFVNLILTKNIWTNSLFIVSRPSSETQLNIVRFTNSNGKGNEKAMVLVERKMIGHPLFVSEPVPDIFYLQVTIFEIPNCKTVL